jgi:hypothetical protein
MVDKRISIGIILLTTLVVLASNTSADADFLIKNVSNDLLYNLSDEGNFNVTTGWIAENGVLLSNLYCQLVGCSMTGMLVTTADLGADDINATSLFCLGGTCINAWTQVNASFTDTNLNGTHAGGDLKGTYPSPIVTDVWVNESGDSIAGTIITTGDLKGDDLNATGLLVVGGTGINAWTQVNVTYSAGDNITISGGTISHTDTSSQADSDNSGRTYIQDVLLDDHGHIVGLATSTETVTDTNVNNTETLIIGTVMASEDVNASDVNVSGLFCIDNSCVGAWSQVNVTSTDTNLNGTHAGGDLKGTYPDPIVSDVWINATGDTITGDLVVSSADVDLTTGHLSGGGQTNATIDATGNFIVVLG